MNLTQVWTKQTMHFSFWILQFVVGKGFMIGHWESVIEFGNSGRVKNFFYS